MEIDLKKINVDESRSNPMAAAMVYPLCPIGAVCMYIAVGGALINQCANLVPIGEGATCSHSETPGLENTVVTPLS